MLYKLISSAETGFFYVGKKSTLNAAFKIQTMKFDPIVNRMCLFTEAKLKKKGR